METEGTAQMTKLHPYCDKCGWRKGGKDSWDGKKCKCGHSEPPMKPFVEEFMEVAKKQDEHFQKVREDLKASGLWDLFTKDET
jgi:Zn-finger protein